MTRYYTTLAKFERDGFDIIVDKTWEDAPIGDLFDSACYDIAQLERQVNNGTYDWFMLRVRVLVEGLELTTETVGGCLYENANQVLKDGTAEDLIGFALIDAKQQVYRLSKRFAALSEQVDRDLPLDRVFG